MQTLGVLLVAAAAAFAVARPPGPTDTPARLLGPPMPMPLSLSMQKQSYPYLMPQPRVLFPRYMGYEDSPALSDDWLSKEIERLNQMNMEEDEEVMNPYESDFIRLYSQNRYLQNLIDSPSSFPQQDDVDSIQRKMEAMKAIPIMAPEPHPMTKQPHQDMVVTPVFKPHNKGASSKKHNQFAYTPMDQEYYVPFTKYQQSTLNKESEPEGLGETLEPKVSMLIEPPRQTRQNPLNKQKHLLEPDLGKLNAGLSHEDGDFSRHPHHQHSHILEGGADPADSIYSIALIAAVGAALTMAIVGFAFGWYTLSKKAKAAADVDYPAYGVTGPSVDNSGDRKLAHSAHMYHYQHQKQQIIAMERNGLDQRAGSVSDPESEEENEEGDYTVYECPGFATTGNMEVKNPLFSEDPTPVSPGKCEVIKQQPKD